MEDNKTRSLFTREITSMPEKENQVRCMGCMEEFSAEFGLCPECGYVIGTPPKLKSYLRPGLILSGRYMLGKVIGQGGFGITYIGWDEKERRKVAVKEFFPSALSTREDGETNIICYNGKAEQYFKEGIRKMLDEGNRLSKYASNPNIVDVYDYFEENGTAYIVMEYLEGKSLKEYAAEKGGRLEPREAVNLMIPVIGALEEMHKENMIHRDIAPDNIYICNDGKIKLLDFGSARIAVQDAEKSLSVMVKPGYAPKEQYASRSKQGPWTDVYSVCATIYKFITGESPIESIEREVTPLKTFAEFGIEGQDELETVLFKGLEPEPENRIRSAEELKTMLLDILSTDECGDRQEQEDETAENKDKGTEWKGLVAIFAVILIILILALVTMKANQNDSRENDYDDYYNNERIVIYHDYNSVSYYGRSDITRYVFYVESTGAYTFESDNYSDGYDLKAELWRNGTELLADDDSGEGNDFSLSYHLNAGDTVILVVEDFNVDDSVDININVSKFNDVLSLGSNLMNYGNASIMRYVFYVEETGSYTFTSDNAPNGHNLKAELWKNGSYLAYNDDYYMEDFSITEYLYAGETVTLVVSAYNDYVHTADINVTVNYEKETIWLGYNTLDFNNAKLQKYSFYAYSSGWYTFQSDNYDDMSGYGCDYKATLYKYGSMIAYNDDFVGRDFYIEEYLYAGETVTLVVSPLSGDASVLNIEVTYGY